MKKPVTNRNPHLLPPLLPLQLPRFSLQVCGVQLLRLRGSHGSSDVLPHYVVAVLFVVEFELRAAGQRRHDVSCGCDLVPCGEAAGSIQAQ